jgi:hypothetical protein
MAKISLSEATALNNYYSRFSVVSGSVLVDAGQPVGSSAVVCASDGNSCRHSFADGLYHCTKEGCDTAFSMLPVPRPA